MKIGDKVRLTSSGKQIYPNWSEGTIIDFDRDNLFYAKVQFEGEEAAWVFFSEIEPVNDGLLPVGTRVRCKNLSRFNNNEGEIVGYSYAHDYPYLIQWDNYPVHNLKSENNGHGGMWTAESFEVIKAESDPEPNEELLALRAVVEDAAWVFNYFAEQHIAKNTPEADYKAMFNLMMADRLNAALNFNK